MKTHKPIDPMVLARISQGGVLVKVRARVIVSGRVQGVFFRSETRDEAKRRRVNGWVRNLPDGRVEAVFEGEEKPVKELVDFCRRGPAGAGVASVDVTWESYRGEFHDFVVKYGRGF